MATQYEARRQQKEIIMTSEAVHVKKNLRPSWDSLKLSKSPDHGRHNLKGKFCNVPFDHVEVGTGGKIYMCCPSWLPKIIGNIEHQTLSEAWNGEIASQIRKSITDGNFKYCNHSMCPAICEGTLPDINESNIRYLSFPKKISFNTDESCNIECPSCRVSKILHTSGPLYESRFKNTNKLWEEIKQQPKNQDLTLRFTGSGDPWGSKIFREILFNHNIQDNPHMYFTFNTNGVMLTERTWQRMNGIEKKTKVLGISFDAGTKFTYENITRKGGNWDQLLKNVRYVSELKKSNPHMILEFDYVTQLSNHEEMLRFCKVIYENCPNYNKIRFSLLHNWGTWPLEEYNKRSIWKEDNPEHENWLKHLALPYFDKFKIEWGNISYWRKKAFSSYGTDGAIRKTKV